MALYYAATGAISGTSGGQTIATIHNPSASTTVLRVFRAAVRGTPSALASVGPFLYHIVRTTGVPTGGSSVTAGQQISSASAPQGVVLTSSTATASGGDFWVGTPGSALSLVGVAPGGPVEDPLKDPIIDIALLAGEALMVRTDAASVNWTHWVYFVWSEG